MKRVSVLLAGLALSLASSAGAAGLNLAWDHCWSEGGVVSRFFACDTSTGSDVLVASVIPGVDHPAFVGVEAILYLTSLGDLPDWWQLYNTGSCRETAISVSTDLSQEPRTVCRDPWGGPMIGGIAAYQTTLYPPPSPLNVPVPTTATLKVAFVLMNPTALPGQIEYSVFRVILTHEKATGEGACAGCTQGACISFGWAKLAEVTPDGSPPVKEVLCSPAANALVTWECASGKPDPPSWECIEREPPMCAAIVGCSVAARNRTWGSVKALYR